MGMIGSELGTVVGDEVDETTASVAWATSRILVLAGVCYLPGSLALVLNSPQGTLDLEVRILQTIMNLSWARQFQWLPIVLDGRLSISVLAASIAWFDAGSRTLWRGADEKWISAWFSELHPQLRIPVRASLLQADFFPFCWPCVTPEIAARMFAFSC